MSSIQSKCLRCLVIAILVLASCPRALAVDAGSLQGIVTGPDGQPASQISILLTSVQAGVQIRLRTDLRGFYEARDLPPGIDYEVEVSDDRGILATIFQDRVVLRAGEMTWEPFQLHLTIHEWIRVAGEHRDHIVNLKETGTRTTYDHVFLEGLPLFCGF